MFTLNRGLVITLALLFSLILATTIVACGAKSPQEATSSEPAMESPAVSSVPAPAQRAPAPASSSSSAHPQSSQPTAAAGLPHRRTPGRGGASIGGRQYRTV